MARAFGRQGMRRNGFVQMVRISFVEHKSRVDR